MRRFALGHVVLAVIVLAGLSTFGVFLAADPADAAKLVVVLGPGGGDARRLAPTGYRLTGEPAVVAATPAGLTLKSKVSQAAPSELFCTFRMKPPKGSTPHISLQLAGATRPDKPNRRSTSRFQAAAITRPSAIRPRSRVARSRRRVRCRRAGARVGERQVIVGCSRRSRPAGRRGPERGLWRRCAGVVLINPTICASDGGFGTSESASIRSPVVVLPKPPRPSGAVGRSSGGPRPHRLPEVASVTPDLSDAAFVPTVPVVGTEQMRAGGRCR